MSGIESSASRDETVEGSDTNKSSQGCDGVAGALKLAGCIRDQSLLGSVGDALACATLSSA